MADIIDLGATALADCDECKRYGFLKGKLVSGEYKLLCGKCYDRR